MSQAKIRPMRDSDLNFILSTWLKSYYDALKFYSSGTIRVPFPKDDVFFQGHQAKIKSLLLSAKTECLVSVAPDDDNQILAWIVFDPECLHYCFVKHVFRQMGIGKSLMAHVKTATRYSHHTTRAKHINEGLLYDPYKF